MKLYRHQATIIIEFMAENPDKALVDLISVISGENAVKAPKSLVSWSVVNLDLKRPPEKKTRTKKVKS